MSQPSSPTDGRRHRRGFTAVELIVVVSIIGVLLLIALPTYMSIVPRGELRADAEAFRDVMKMGRSSAANYQRPVRILIDCRETITDAIGSCRIVAQVAVYNAAGLVKGWARLGNSDVRLHKSTRFNYKGSLPLPGKANYARYASLFRGYYYDRLDANEKLGYDPVVPGSFAWDNVVVVFTPGGEAISACDVRLQIKNRHLGDSDVWLLTLYNPTGHVSLNRETI
ncbi:MAG: prepilin-type N-terminal cleavage/methylation domain-containing protein [Deltaproteobacteria bacterium]|jgi:prepilin-type N-terminal cleavage/methylation domain-containing protein|nr:prepilin-type N-terminal cleavage/methylation domain-containing protein [Deltaproteobacteria bacterium]